MRLKVQKTFHTELKEKMDTYIHEVYRSTKKFPREEMYGVTSQLRRASLSVILNYIEGYTRIGDREHLHFLKISYSSLQESKYLLDFSVKEKYLEEKEFISLIAHADKIGAMLWGILKNIGRSSSKIQDSRFKMYGIA